MRELAEGVWQLRGAPPNAVNVYLLDGVLIDAATRLEAGRIARQLEGQSVTAHALTHAHPDHQGSSHALCERLGIPFWVGEGDADAAEDPRLMADGILPGTIARNPIARSLSGMLAGPGHRVDRRLREGDEVGGFAVLETPGHTAGHLSFWRESDRVLVLGDVVFNVDLLGGRPGMIEPPSPVNRDSDLNRASARRLADLEPDLVCFGHGPPHLDGASFAEFVGGL
jgi:glyoxylase-like metal-dependent hydrolase (beta-lactamase superfamily II)